MNLENLPPTYSAALKQVVGALGASLGENLAALILYGSAVRGDLDPEASDLNLFIVLKAVTPQAHAAIRDAIRAKIRIEPLIAGQEGLERTMCVFALKFLSIHRNYRVLAGQDVLAGFKVSKPVFRFLAEQELRNLRLRTVNAFVTSGKGPQSFGNYLHRNAKQFVIVLCDAVRTREIDPKGPLRDRVITLRQALETDTDVLSEILELKPSDARLDPKTAYVLYARLLSLLNRAVQWMEAEPLAEPV